MIKVYKEALVQEYVNMIKIAAEEKKNKSLETRFKVEDFEEKLNSKLIKALYGDQIYKLTGLDLNSEYRNKARKLARKDTEEKGIHYDKALSNRFRQALGTSMLPTKNEYDYLDVKNKLGNKMALADLALGAAIMSSGSVLPFAKKRPILASASALGATVGASRLANKLIIDRDFKKNPKHQEIIDNYRKEHMDRINNLK